MTTQFVERNSHAAGEGRLGRLDKQVVMVPHQDEGVRPPAEEPDVELDLPADGFLGGKDAQLDWAIQDLLGKIAKDPRDLKPAPPIPPRPLVPLK